MKSSKVYFFLQQRTSYIFFFRTQSAYFFPRTNYNIGFSLEPLNPVYINFSFFPDLFFRSLVFRYGSARDSSKPSHFRRLAACKTKDRKGTAGNRTPITRIRTQCTDHYTTAPGRLFRDFNIPSLYNYDIHDLYISVFQIRLQ